MRYEAMDPNWNSGWTLLAGTWCTRWDRKSAQKRQLWVKKVWKLGTVFGPWDQVDVHGVNRCHKSLYLLTVDTGFSFFLHPSSTTSTVCGV